MAVHCNILTWRMPWTEEPGELHSIWSQRVRHDRRDLAHTGFPGGSLVKNLPANAGNKGDVVRLPGREDPLT